MTESPPPDFARLARRQDRSMAIIGILAIAVVALVGMVGLLSVRMQATAESTAASVELLEGRTPLFAALQANEDRIICISELDARLGQAIAEGLIAVADENDEALAGAIDAIHRARHELSLLGTDRDPCRPTGN